MKQGLYDESEKVYDKYIYYILVYTDKYTSAFYDNSKLNLAKVYSKMGAIKLKQGKYSESEVFYKKALETRKKNIDKLYFHLNNKKFTANANLWVELNNLGFLKIQEKKYKDAKNYFDDALKIEQINISPIPWQIYYNLSILYRELGDYKLAEKYAEKLLIDSPPQSDVIPIPDVNKLEFVKITSMFNSLFKKNLAAIYAEEKKYKDAENLVKIALLTDKALYNEKAPEILCDHYKLLNIYKEMNDKNSDDLESQEYKQINMLKYNILSTKKYSGNKLTSQLENICRQ